MKASRQPRDLDHPYGHGRLETIGALGVAGLLVCTGAGTGYASLDALYSMVASGGSRILEGHLWVAMLAAGVSLVVKETLYRATKAAGEAAGSKVDRRGRCACPPLRSSVLVASNRLNEASIARCFPCCSSPCSPT